MELNARFFVKLYLLLTNVFYSPLGNCTYLSFKLIQIVSVQGYLFPKSNFFHTVIEP